MSLVKNEKVLHYIHKYEHGEQRSLLDYYASPFRVITNVSMFVSQLAEVIRTMEVQQTVLVWRMEVRHMILQRQGIHNVFQKR